MKQITYMDALREAFIEEMERDETVFLIGESVVRAADPAAFLRTLIGA